MQPSTLSEAFSLALAATAAFTALDRASQKIVDFEAFFAASNAKGDSRSHLANLLNEEPHDLILHGQTSDRRRTFFGPSTKVAGSWQLTRFDRQGEPWGDTSYPTRLQGIKEFLQEIELESLKSRNGQSLNDTPGTEDRLHADRARLAQTCALDNDGQPLTLYHGTQADFSRFAPNPRGIFFSEVQSKAEPFSRIRKGTSVIKAVHLVVKRPWTMIRYSDDTPYSRMLDQSIESLKSQGYDSIHCPDDQTWIAFDPNQIINAVPVLFDTEAADYEEPASEAEAPRG